MIMMKTGLQKVFHCHVGKPDAVYQACYFSIVLNKIAFRCMNTLKSEEQTEYSSIELPREAAVEKNRYINYFLSV